MDVATILMRVDLPVNFVILLGVVGILAAIVFFGVLVEVKRERRQHAGKGHKDPSSQHYRAWGL